MSDCAKCKTPLGTQRPDGYLCIRCRLTAERDEALAVLRDWVETLDQEYAGVSFSALSPRERKCADRARALLDERGK